MNACTGCPTKYVVPVGIEPWTFYLVVPHIVNSRQIWTAGGLGNSVFPQKISVVLYSIFSKMRPSIFPRPMSKERHEHSAVGSVKIWISKDCDTTKVFAIFSQ